MSKILGNIFSNWAGLIVSIIIAFVVSPIMINLLGKELYGTWTLIVSITSYFTVLDFGVNTAIVRYVSSAVARKDHALACAVYSTSIAIFGLVAVGLLLFSFCFGYFLPDFFAIAGVTRGYLYAVFIISAIDLASNLVFSVYQGSLVGLQEFKFINGNSIVINVVRSLILVWSLKHGASLLTLAFLQLAASIARAICQRILIRIKYAYLQFDFHAVDRKTLKTLYSYSVYSFVIAVALKLLFYTDSVVIGARIGVEDIAFYAIPSTLLDYLEKFVWSMIAVMIPVISTNETLDKNEGNIRLYILGTRYSLLLSLPIVIALYFYGDDFIRLWVGPEFGERSRWVLRYLLIGFGFSFSQLIAHGILKGISKHKVLAYILGIEACANLAMSIVLAKPYGIDGVAVGTMIPLLLASTAIIIYCCHVIEIDIWQYLFKAYAGPIVGVVPAFLFIWWNPHLNTGYAALLLNCALVAVCFLVVTIPLCMESEHRVILWNTIKRFVSGKKRANTPR